MLAVSYGMILTRDSERAAAALRAIGAQGLESELLLVLNEADEEMRALAQATDGARILHDGVDVGVIYGWNLVFREAQAERVCIVHEDCEPQPGCVSRLIATLDERHDAAAVCPAMHLPDGLTHCGAWLWSDGAVTRAPRQPEWTLIPVDGAPSACLVLEREAARAVGGYDPALFPGVYADFSLSKRLWAAGWTVLCDARAEAVHRTGAMVDRVRGPRRSERFRQFLIDRNRALVQRAWSDLLAEQVVRADPHDARNPSADELAAAAALTEGRERRAMAAGPPRPGPDALDLPRDLEAHVTALRRDLEDELLDQLIRHEAEQAAELERVHRAYAELWEDRDRLHRGYTELLSERQLRPAETTGSTA